VLCHSQNLACGKGGRSQLCEAPVGPFRQLTPDPFTTPIPKLDGDKALDLEWPRCEKTAVTRWPESTRPRATWKRGPPSRGPWAPFDSPDGRRQITAWLESQSGCRGYRYQTAPPGAAASSLLGTRQQARRLNALDPVRIGYWPAEHPSIGHPLPTE
jgi:hypothetical protein